MENVNRDYYEVIGLPRNADQSEIDAVCYRLAEKYRADRNPGDPLAAQNFALIDEVYETLGSPSRRATYDANLADIPRVRPEDKTKNQNSEQASPGKMGYKQTRKYDKNTKQILAVIGSIVLFIGVFMPIVSVPIVGNMNYFQNGKGDGTIVLILAGISLLLAMSKKYKGLWFTGLGSLAVMLFTFYNFQSKMAEAKANMESSLAGNPFRGIADMAMQSIQLQWGWAILIVGAGLLIAAAALKEDSQ
jgi:curved DNA-binding protein CbpA